MLYVKDLHKSYMTGKKEYPVLKGINFQIAKGEFVAVMGPSGSGKSTLLNCISCYIPFDKGEITLGGMVQADPLAVGLATLSIGLKSFSGLSIIPIEDLPRDFHRIYMVYKRDAFRTRSVESFIEFASDYVPPRGAIPSTATSA